GPSRRRWLAGGGLALAAGLAGLSLTPLATRLRADHATGVGERRDLALADGSHVLLNTDSALSVDYTADRRGVALQRGEAFFAVARDPARPF
ncbi:FecR domain-containing protein, partial [Acinetobacter baumannii]